MNKTTFPFNMASESYKSSLDEGKQKILENFKTDADAKLFLLEKDHAENKDRRIAEREELLTRKNEQQLNLPRPSFAPPPRLKQPSEIKAEAAQDVNNSYIQARQNILIEQQRGERDFLVKELGLSMTKKNPDKDIDR